MRSTLGASLLTLLAWRPRPRCPWGEGSLCGVGLLGVPEAVASEGGSLCHGDGAQGRAPASPRQVMLAIPPGRGGEVRALERAGGPLLSSFSSMTESSESSRPPHQCTPAP
jgi:hypothetical protein